MKFRFTLTHRGSENTPFAVPALNNWETETGADEEWALGPAPSVTLPGVTFGGDSSEYLWVDYTFEDDVEYTITANYTKTYLSGVDNPRAIELSILDTLFAVVFTETDSTPVSPGGTGSVSISFTGNSSCRKIAIKVTDGSEVTFVIDQVSGLSIDPSDITVSQEINEPDGWKDSILKLGRDKDYRSLIEFFEGSFIFYGDNGVVNGGIDFIKGLELTYGPDVSIEMLIELTLDDYNYDQVFLGQLDLSLAEELMDNKFRIPIIRDNFWAKFMNRRDTPVDLAAATDLDLNAITDPVDPIDVILLSQIITYFTHYTEPYSITYDNVGTYNMLNWDVVIQDDIKLFSIARATVDFDSFSILGLFEAEYDGEFQIEIKITIAEYISATPEWAASIGSNAFRIKKTNESGVDTYGSSPEVTLDIDSSGTDTWATWYLNVTYQMFRGEQLSISFHTASGNYTIFGTKKIVWVADCDLATTQAISLSGEQNVDGVMTSTSRVLVKHQGNTYENGIYDTSAGAWTRATDYDGSGEITDTAVYVTAGDFQADTAWRQIQEVNTIGVDPIIFEITDPSDERFRYWPGYDVAGDEGVENYIKITAKTRFPQTQRPAMLVHDAGASILKSYGLGEDNPFYSELFGSQLTHARQYDNDGCAWKHAVMRGLQVRGYTLAAKPFFQSFNEWWKGVNPIFNLGLTYETIEGSTVDPTEAEIESLTTWDDAGGPFPGGWNYALFSYPFTSVNGDGGVEGYTCGTMATVGGQTYVITTVVEIFDTGTNPTNINFIFAILDSGFNEIETQEFNYTSDGFKVETFNITPSSDGTYFGMRVVNDTVSDTKSLVFRLAEGDTVDQVLVNEDFDSGTFWTNEGAGTAWVIGSGAAEITLASGLSQALTQEFVGGNIGEYHFISEYNPSDISGGDTVDLTVNFYDSGNNLVSTKTDLLFNNNNKPFDWVFTSLVVVTKIEIIAEITAGSDIVISLPYAALFIVVPTEIVVVPDMQVIRVEEVEHFYDPDYVLTISNIRDITRKYDNDKIYNKINMGYNTWKSEDIQGIDDTQTQHIYSTRFEKIGQTITLWSDFIAASLAIETTRRKTITESTDYKFDDSTFIIAINPDDVSPDVYRPELDEEFSSIENLQDSELRYNTRLSVAHNFLRWRKWFNGCLQNFLTSYYKFVRGEGNFDMITTMVEQSPDCLDESFDNQPLSEKQDIPVQNEFIHLPNYYEFEVPLDWEDYKIIRNNRKKAIGISLTDDNHVALFIDQLDYNVMHAKAKISGWTNEFMELSVIEDRAATQTCLTAADSDAPSDCPGGITDEDEEFITDELGACITA